MSDVKKNFETAERNQLAQNMRGLAGAARAYADMCEQLAARAEEAWPTATGEWESDLTKEDAAGTLNRLGSLFLDDLREQVMRAYKHLGHPIPEEVTSFDYAKSLKTPILVDAEEVVALSPMPEKRGPTPNEIWMERFLLGELTPAEAVHAFARKGETPDRWIGFGVEPKIRKGE